MAIEVPARSNARCTCGKHADDFVADLHVAVGRALHVGRPVAREVPDPFVRHCFAAAVSADGPPEGAEHLALVQVATALQPLIRERHCDASMTAFKK